MWIGIFSRTQQRTKCFFFLAAGLSILSLGPVLIISNRRSIRDLTTTSGRNRKQEWSLNPVLLETQVWPRGEGGIGMINNAAARMSDDYVSELLSLLSLKRFTLLTLHLFLKLQRSRGPVPHIFATFFFTPCLRCQSLRLLHKANAF